MQFWSRGLTTSIQGPFDQEILRGRNADDGATSIVSDRSYQAMHFSVIDVSVFLLVSTDWIEPSSVLPEDRL